MFLRSEYYQSILKLLYKIPGIKFFEFFNEIKWESVRVSKSAECWPREKSVQLKDKRKFFNLEME